MNVTLLMRVMAHQHSELKCTGVPENNKGMLQV